MQDVLLKGPRVIDGAVRQPAEGMITVSDEEYDRLVADEAIVTGEDDDLAGQKVADLKKIATDEGVDLGEATKRDDILAAIRAHRAANPAAA